MMPQKLSPYLRRLNGSKYRKRSKNSCSTSEDDEITTSFQKMKGFLFLRIFPTHSSKLSVKQENRKEIIENLQRMRTSHLDKIVTWRKKELSKETTKDFDNVCRDWKIEETGWFCNSNNKNATETAWAHEQCSRKLTLQLSAWHWRRTAIIKQIKLQRKWKRQQQQKQYGFPYCLHFLLLKLFMQVRCKAKCATPSPSLHFIKY